VHRHRPIRVGFPNGHMMFRGDRRINTHAHTHHPRPRGRAGGTSVDSHERALPSRRDEEHPGAPFPPEADTHGSSPTAGEPLARPLTNPRGERCLPRTPDTTTMGATRTPPMLVGDPVPTERPAAHSCTATGTTDPPIPSTGPARRQTPVSDLFHEPEAHPKTAATGIPPMVTVRGHRPAPGRPSVIQAIKGWQRRADPLVRCATSVSPFDDTGRFMVAPDQPANRSAVDGRCGTD